jgi:hypothetical protein
MANNLVIGSSHSVFFSRCVGEADCNWNQASTDLIPIRSRLEQETFSWLFITPNTRFLDFRVKGDELVITHDEHFTNLVRQFNVTGSRVFFMVGGNEHNSRFFYRADHPFDFPHEKVTGFLEGRSILPSSSMRGIIKSITSNTQYSLQFLAHELQLATKFIVAPPPPIGSEEHILAHPEKFDFSRYQLEDRSVRLKFYELYLENLAYIASALNIILLRPPEQNRDEDGFLKKAFWEKCTHANAGYYNAVLEQAGIESHASV